MYFCTQGAVAWPSASVAQPSSSPASKDFRSYRSSPVVTPNICTPKDGVFPPRSQRRPLPLVAFNSRRIPAITPKPIHDQVSPVDTFDFPERQAGPENLQRSPFRKASRAPFFLPGRRREDLLPIHAAFLCVGERRQTISSRSPSAGPADLGNALTNLLKVGAASRHWRAARIPLRREHLGRWSYVGGRSALGP